MHYTSILLRSKTSDYPLGLHPRNNDLNLRSNCYIIYLFSKKLGSPIFTALFFYISSNKQTRCKILLVNPSPCVGLLVHYQRLQNVTNKKQKEWKKENFEKKSEGKEKEKKIQQHTAYISTG